MAMDRPIDEEMLRAFYGYAVLPQFGIARNIIAWRDGIDLGPDESAYPFSLDGASYILIFEDAGGLAKIDAYIREQVVVGGRSYEYVKPVSKSSSTPSYDGFRLPAPHQYIPNVTGTFTLIRLR